VMGLTKFPQRRLKLAKSLRSNTTEAERRIWQALRRLPLAGTHFRRQVAIGPYVADFACMRKMLIVEIDGGQHSADTHARKDAKRTEWLEREGYRVIRFWNNDVMQNLEGVLASLNEALSSHPTPARDARRPSPSRGG
jgi:very-short-patch-repair endonuclease